MKITPAELLLIEAQLPHDGIKRIANDLNIPEEGVANNFRVARQHTIATDQMFANFTAGPYSAAPATYDENMVVELAKELLISHIEIMWNEIILVGQLKANDKSHKCY